MSATSPQIGLGVSPFAAPDSDPVGAAQLAEELGFDFVSVSDHPGSSAPVYEAWTVLTWIAAATRRVRVLPRVLGVPFRSPAVLAKSAESLDRLSGGRLLLGLGAGGDDAELAAFGLSGQRKLAGLRDAIEIARRLWTAPQATYDGAVHAVRGARLEPKPRQPIPIWLGTFGPRALALTGELADGWIPSRGYQPDEQLPVMRRRVLEAAATAGRDPAAITCALNLETDVRSAPGDDPLSGPPAALVDALVSFAAMGFTSFNLIPKDYDRRQVERLGLEVLPGLRAAMG